MPPVTFQIDEKKEKFDYKELAKQIVDRERELRERKEASNERERQKREIKRNTKHHTENLDKMNYFITLVEQYDEYYKKINNPSDSDSDSDSEEEEFELHHLDRLGCRELKFVKDHYPDYYLRVEQAYQSMKQLFNQTSVETS